MEPGPLARDAGQASGPPPAEAVTNPAAAAQALEPDQVVAVLGPHDLAPAINGGVRRQWRTAVIALVAVLALATGGTMAAFLQVAGHYKDAATRLDYTITVTSTLTHKITDHESQAHSLWNGAPVDHAVFLGQEQQIVALFSEANTRLTDLKQHTLIAHAAQAWKSVYTSRGLWGPSAGPRPGVTLAMQQQFGSASDEVVTTLSQLTQDAIIAGSSDLSVADTYESVAFGLLGGMLALVLAVIVYLARRMTSDVVRPLEMLQHAARRLRQGDLDHRVQVPASCQDNEVGQLAADFNAMATALDESHRNLTLLASHDPLTGLPNRAEFQLWLGRRITGNRRLHGDQDIVSVMFIDVDDFKFVNDSLGHAAGDVLLTGVADRLTSCVRGGDVIARLGGDEFAILLKDSFDEGSSADTVAERVIAAFSTPFVIADTNVSVTVSIGVAIAERDCDDPGKVLAQADYAMYTSKRSGKGCHTFFQDATTPDHKTAPA